MPSGLNRCAAGLFEKNYMREQKNPFSRILISVGAGSHSVLLLSGMRPLSNIMHASHSIPQSDINIANFSLQRRQVGGERKGGSRLLIGHLQRNQSELNLPLLPPPIL